MSTAYYSSFYPAEDSGVKGSAAFLPTMTNAVVYLYRRSATALTASDKPNGNVIYTFATATVDVTAVTNGWTSTIPSGSDPLYVVAATASEYTPTDTIATGEWTTPVILAQNGLSGLSTATVFLFQRNNTGTAPALPSTNLTYTFSTGALTGTLSGWSQTAPDSASGAYLFITTATAISSGATYVITPANWAAVRILAQNGADGEDAYTVYLTNETHTLPASSTGVVSSYSGATGNFAILKDGVDVSGNFSLATVSGSNPQNLTIVYSGATYTVTGGFDAGEDTASITIRATGSGVHLGKTFDKIFTLSKSKAGGDGTSAKGLSVTADRQIVIYDGAGNLLPPTGQDIVFTALKQNTTATVTWTLKDNKGNVLTPGTYLSATSGDTVTMTAANFNNALAVNTSTGVLVTATCDGLSDTITVAKVANGQAGSNGTRVGVLELYRWSSTVPTTFPAGTSTYTWATGTFTLPGTPNGWSLAPGTPSAGQTLYGITVIVSNTNTTATDTVTWNSTTPYALGSAGLDGASGLNSASVALYARTINNTAPAVATTGSATYTFSTGAISGQPSGWTINVPSSGGGFLWVIRATAAATTATDTIANTEWSAPVLLSQDGAAGADAPKIAIVYIYRRAASAPALPTAETTYTFSSNTLTGLNNSWTQAIPTGTDPLYVSLATASSTGTTDTIAAAEWSTPVVLVQNGSNGSNGTRTAILDVYRWSSTLPTTFPSGNSTYTWATGQFTAPATLNSWTLTPGTPVAGQTLYVLRQIYSDSNTSATSTVTWSATSPFPITSAGTNGNNGSNGVNAISLSLSNESATILAYANGTLAVAASTVNGLAKLFDGNTDVTASTSWSIGATSGATATINNTTNKGYYELTGLSANSGTVTITGTYNSQAYSKVLVVTKVNVGYEIVATLPTTNLFEGRVVFLTADDKLYRYNGTAWTAAVPSADISGQLTDAQIAALAASKLTGQITGTQITDEAISTAKIAAGAVTANQIAANAVVADKIAANAITAGKIEANAVTADKINAGAITAAKLAATNVVTASAQIQDGIITTAKIGDAQITTAKIGALQVTNANIQNLTIGTQKIEDLAITRGVSFFYVYSYRHGTQDVWYTPTAGNQIVYVGPGNGDYAYQITGYDQWGKPIYDYVFVGAGNGDYTITSTLLEVGLLTPAAGESAADTVNIEVCSIIQRSGGSDDYCSMRVQRVNDGLLLAQQYDSLRAYSFRTTYTVLFRDPAPLPGVTNTYRVQFLNDNDPNTWIRGVTLRATLLKK